MRPMLRIACWALLGLAVRSTCAQEPAALPPPPPSAPLAGPLRVWTNPQMQEIVQRWSAGFRQHHPDVQVVANYQGSDVAVAGLYTKCADIAFLGRDPTASEIQAFEWIFRYRPARVPVLTGSLDQAGKSPALVLFVHKDNPLAGLTLAQADAIFGHERLRGGDRITTWGQLGLGGDWKDQPIHLYGYDAYSGSGRYFRQAVLEDSRHLNWDRMQEIGDGKDRAGRPLDAATRIHAALATDRYGIAVSALAPDASASKALALADVAGGPLVDPSPESLVARRYPLTRSVIALVNRAPGQPLDPKVAEFLRYVLGSEGQAQAANGGYLPLAQGDAATQLGQIR